MTMNCHHASARSVVRTGSAPTRWTSTASRITPARRSSRLRNLMIEVEAVDRTIIPPGTESTSPRLEPPGGLRMRDLARAPQEKRIAYAACLIARGDESYVAIPLRREGKRITRGD